MESNEKNKKYLVRRKEEEEKNRRATGKKRIGGNTSCTASGRERRMGSSNDGVSTSASGRAGDVRSSRQWSLNDHHPKFSSIDVSPMPK
ncbi:hypothetical protein Cni_G26812 [Canna indica]|uniref:Uncharacterized protein n=1 Tax=Canna indica TaxID=4628 RepID=A0AAQ3KZM7_9LILI|nr:hypothetical protein Cni_G26812 [Canna indica]